ncbi:hypothetical protein BDN72DRAFT_959905 [Pluteus cervinus]|uniref:Uncharacterized protein n=1 Tax=Pluteus cervinus TaxID=181527 RepID=A0ACD3ASP8_9AGAR|nr:hypothetical protein BDN72DRAFT_959905 [Pluteus cervinus]
MKPPIEMQEEFVDQPKEFIDEAREGSVYELEVVARYWQLLPVPLCDEIEEVFFHHLNAADPPTNRTSEEIESCISTESLRAFWSIYALAQTKKEFGLYNADRYTPGIIKAWPGIFKWGAFFFVSCIQTPVTHSDRCEANSAACKRLTRHLAREIISRSWFHLVWSIPARKLMSETCGAVEIATKLWFLEYDGSEKEEDKLECSLFVRASLLTQLSREEVSTGAMDRVIEASGGDPTRITRAALTRLENAIKTSDSEFSKEGAHCVTLFDLVMRLCRPPKPSLTPETRKALLDQGAVATAVKVLLKVASVYNGDHHSNDPNSMLLLWPHSFLRHYLEATEGFGSVLQALDAGLLTAFVECSPLYEKLKDEEYLAVSIAIRETIPKYLAYLPVLQAAGAAFKNLKRTRQYLAIVDTRAWGDFSSFLMIMSERQAMMEHSRAMTKHSTVCSNVHCAKADVRNKFRKCGRCGKTFYCSKECQTTHWKEAHKGVCDDKVEVGQMKGPLLPLRDRHYLNTLNVHLARQSLRNLKDTAAKEFPDLPLEDFMVCIDYREVPPIVGLVVRAQAVKEMPQYFDWPRFRQEFISEPFTMIVGIMPHGVEGTRYEMSVVPGCIWKDDLDKELMSEEKQIDDAAIAIMTEYALRSL